MGFRPTAQEGGSQGIKFEQNREGAGARCSYVGGGRSGAGGVAALQWSHGIPPCEQTDTTETLPSEKIWGVVNIVFL